MSRNGIAAKCEQRNAGGQFEEASITNPPLPTAFIMELTVWIVAGDESTARMSRAACSSKGSPHPVPSSRKHTPVWITPAAAMRMKMRIRPEIVHSVGEILDKAVRNICLSTGGAEDAETRGSGPHFTDSLLAGWPRRPRRMPIQ